MVLRVSVKGQSRQQLLDAVQTLSLKKGFPATTVDDVCTEAGVSKGSFYHHFKSKDDIGLAALDCYFNDLVVAYTTGVFTGVADPVERLRAFFAHAVTVCSGPLLRSGCMLGSFALDLAETHPDVQAKLSVQFKTLSDFVSGLISDAAVALGTSVPADALGQQFMAIVQGSIVLAKAHSNALIPVTGIQLMGNHLDLLLETRNNRDVIPSKEIT
jgi:TetR/AcrR family transcriptional repressor of nem operon